LLNSLLKNSADPFFPLSLARVLALALFSEAGRREQEQEQDKE
jgi:hypothetical protein